MRPGERRSLGSSEDGRVAWVASKRDRDGSRATPICDARKTNERLAK